MQKLTFLLVFLCSWTQVKAQKTDYIAVKINVLSPLANSLNVSLERSINDRSTIEVGIGIHSRESFYFPWAGFQPDGLASTGGNFTYSRKSIIAQWNIFPWKNAPNGLFLGPYFKINSNSGAIITQSANGFLNYDANNWMSVGVGANVGYSYCFKDKWHVSAFLGVGYDNQSSFFPRGISLNEYFTNETWKLVGFYSGKGLDARLGVNIGFAW